jgi:hypothetical protein
MKILYLLHRVLKKIQEWTAATLPTGAIARANPAPTMRPRFDTLSLP